MASTRRARGLFGIGCLCILALTAFLGSGAPVASAVAPTVTIKPASAVTYQGAHVEGEVDPGDHETTFYFQYATQAQFEAAEWQGFAGYSSLPEGAGLTPVEGDLSGLAPGTLYHLRLFAENADGPVEALAPTFETDPVNPPEVEIDPVATFTATTAHFSGTVNSGGSGPGEATEYRFSCSPNCPGLEGFQAVTSDGSDQLVEANVENLEPNIEYTVALLARNAQTQAEGQDKEDSTSFTTEAARPSAVTSVNTPDGQGGTIVTGYVNPHNSPLTDCHFEYGLDETYGQSTACEGSLPSGGDAEEVTVDLGGLQPASTYHFIVVAANAAGSTESADGIFVTAPPAGPPAPECPNEALRIERHETQLPDCRAWEMVSPPDKNGGQVTLGAGSIRASSDGGAIVFDSNVAFGDAKGTGAVSSVKYRSDRSPGSWSVHSLSPPQAEFRLAPLYGAVFSWFAPDLSRALLTARDPGLTEDAPAGVANLYLTDRDGGSPVLISATGNSLNPNVFVEPPRGVDVSTDLSHVVFQSGQNLTDNAPPQDPVLCGSFGFCKSRVYEWNNGAVRLVSILPDGTPAEVAVGGRWTTGGVLDSAVSQDGDRVYFSASRESQPARLFLRKNHAETSWVSQSEASTPDAESQEALFEGAAADGTRAFFTTNEPLLDLDENQTRDLYEYTDGADPESESNLTLISQDDNPSDGTEASVDAVLGVSTDGERVYFVAEHRIVAGQGPSNGANIYLWEHGTVRLVASNLDAKSSAANWNEVIRERTSRVSPDGRFLLFTTAAPQIAGLDPAGHQEIYRYDAEREQLACVSCSTDGAPETADATPNYASTPLTLEYEGYVTRALSTNGSRVFFNTAQSLVPSDSNGTVDAYEWEARGVGSCNQPEGCVALLSSGIDDSPSYFADASENGSDAYILTAQPLSRADHGTDMDLYDIRVDGGLPEQPLPPPNCEGDSCQPSLAIPDHATPASAAFAGPGNYVHHRRHHGKYRKHHRKAKAHPRKRNGTHISNSEHG